MRKIFFSIVLITSFLCHTMAQSATRSWGEFSMIPKTFSGRAAAADQIKSGPEYEKALRVYERLCQARGDFRYPVPVFILSKNDKVLAKIDYGQPEKIYLGLKAFQVCESFKENSEAAIAFLLGHELTHYYEKHAWRSNFASENSDLKISKQLDSLSRSLDAVSNAKIREQFQQFKALNQEMQDLAMEAQSDYLGGFLLYSAGFGIFERGDTLIRRLYKTFELSDEMEGYVTRNEREAMSRSSAARMKDLVEVFDMANLLTAIGRYEEAYAFYRSVLTEYQSREIYNNVGTSALLQALKLFTDNELKFRYPVQLDLEMADHRGDAEVRKRNRLLSQALLHFDAAISLDPDYAPAYLNKACALALLGENTRAYFYADVETRKAATGKYAALLPDLETLLGILDAAPDTPEAKEKARKRFSTVIAQSGSSLAAYNLSKLNGTFTALNPSRPVDAEQLDDEPVFRMDHELDPDVPIIRVGESVNFIRNPKKTPHAHLFTCDAPDGRTIFHVTNPDYPGQTAEGIKLGASREAIVKAYKNYDEHPKTIKTIFGEILVYKGILFMLKGDKLERWVVYLEPG